MPSTESVICIIALPTDRWWIYFFFYPENPVNPVKNYLSLCPLCALREIIFCPSPRTL